MLRNVNYVNVE